MRQDSGTTATADGRYDPAGRGHDGGLDAAFDAATDSEGRRITRRELGLIVAFWLLFAVVTVANRVFDPRSIFPQGTIFSPGNQLAVAESLLWVVITPGVFWLAARFPLDRGNRALHLAAYALAGFVVILLVSVTEDALRDAILPPRPAGGRRGPELPWWNLLGRFWLLNDLVRYMGVLAAGLARAYSLRFRARQAQAVRLQAQLAEARLDALRRQLDPHFLFNTLHAVSSLVERDPRGVRRMISRLSELLRYSMEGSHEPEVTLRRELELLRRYLDIMEVRFQGRLVVEMHVDDEALEALVPNMILQPLVENAIKHGIEKLVEQGCIRIDAHVVGTALELRVHDNGRDAVAVAAAARGTGVGLRNTCERLAQLYGDAQRFALVAADEGGTAAEVRLPYHTHSDLHTSELPVPPRATPSAPALTLAATAGAVPPLGRRRGA